MKIIVESEELKQKLIAESVYVHDFAIRCYLKRKGAQRMICLDSDKAGIFMHIYTCPDIIEVQIPLLEKKVKTIKKNFYFPFFICIFTKNKIKYMETINEEIWVVKTKGNKCELYKGKIQEKIENNGTYTDGAKFYNSSKFVFDVKPFAIIIEDGKFSATKVKTKIKGKEVNVKSTYRCFLKESDAQAFFNKIRENYNNIEVKKVSENPYGDLFIIHCRKEQHDESGDFTIVGSKDDSLVRVGIAFCNPKENFSKKEGIRLAKERLESQPIIFANLKKKDHVSVRKFLYDFTDVVKENRLVFSENMYESVKAAETKVL